VDNNKKNTENKMSLRVTETDPKYVGRGIALVDPKVMSDLDLSTGDVVEVSGNRRKTHVLLWSSQQQDYGKKLIRVDGYTRNNLGVGIDDNVYIRRVKTSKA
jgi:transitional endoplasmic reticulum ATPase